SFGNYISNEPIRNRNDNFLTRIDYNPSERNTYSFRYLINDSSTFTPVLSTSGTASGSAQVPGYGLQSDVRTQNFTASWTHLFSSSLVNVGRFAAARFSDLQAGEDHTDPAAYGLPTNVVVPADVALPQIVVSGLSGLGNSNIFPFGDGLPTFQLID